VIFGRDFTASVARQGNSGDDTLSGTSAGESLIGGFGDDLLDGAGGADMLRGGGGDDTLMWRSGMRKADGGSGLDTLRLVSGNASFTAGESTVRNIEQFDLRAGGANTLVLDALGVRAITDTPHRLSVLGDSEDLLNLTGNWTTAAGAASGFTRYTAGVITVDVENDMQVLSGGALALSALNGTNGVRLEGAAENDLSGITLSAAGDVNGDGFDDLVVGAYRASPNGSYSGASYVVFGKASGFAASLNLGTLDGSNGFRLAGVAEFDYSGRAVSAAGDINGDGFDDLVIGATNADSNGSNSGASYVLFGQADSFAASINLNTLDGTNGFRLNGVAAEDYSGHSVSAAGDVNGDGFDDLVVGAIGADPNGVFSGASYVVLGRASGFAASIDLNTLDGDNGFRLDGGAAGDLSGVAVSTAGDINGDGFDDVVVSASAADPNGANSGASYVVFGQAGGFAASLNLTNLDGTNGFRLNGVAAYDLSGRAISTAGDVNGDGFDDLVVGAYLAGPNGAESGASYVVFGQADSFAASLNLNSLDGTNGFRLDGGAANDRSGRAVSAAGDFNGDGFDDLVVGAPFADPNGSSSGASYLVFGQAGGFAASINLNTLDGSNGIRLDGFAAEDYSGRAVSAAGDVNGDGFDDLMVSAHGADPNGINSGASYVIFGREFTGNVAQQGSSGNDTLNGTSEAESLIGGLGNDLLDGAGGADVLRGGGGDDTLVWHDNLRDVDGGSGLDTLRIDGSAVSLDLTLVANNRLTGIERIDLTGSGDNSLTLDIRDVLALPDGAEAFLDSTTHELLIDGNSGDSVASVGQGWVAGAEVTLQGTLYAAYTHADIAVTLLVDTDITRTIN
jgi:hypothetical protein